ncbi:hypothetical protein HMPREF0063_12286 [Aeromicrobium marinum DSM 15272]|uniref:Uncharacterized protein n=1 Tax=Aeromicrobium marinum DSM 15272 TaxID=585531 RepID=E2SCX4_9ACTN|nr:hypothetical protein [Aeromicrobium marinum]EFQ83077.1 hypothetical protein HMPREF0063_12286 [Aeromicrobium marinum DSM 15272]
MRRPREERGAATIFVLGLSVVLLLCAGLVVDGGLAINARMAVADDAEQAARIGADSIDVAALRAGSGIVIDAGLATQRAGAFLANRGYGAGQATVVVDAANGAVTVELRDTTTTLILGLVGINQYDVSAGATSTPNTGPQGAP